jgi:hypothetical protein
MTAPVHDEQLDALTARRERVLAYQGRTLRYYDEAPDGSRQKARADLTLQQIGRDLADLDREIDKRCVELGY